MCVQKTKTKENETDMKLSIEAMIDRTTMGIIKHVESKIKTPDGTKQLILEAVFLLIGITLVYKWFS